MVPDEVSEQPELGSRGFVRFSESILVSADHLNSDGIARDVYKATSGEEHGDVVVKVPKDLHIELLVTKNFELFKTSLTPKDGFEEVGNIAHADIARSLQDSSFVNLYNEVSLDYLELAQVAAEISDNVAKPYGFMLDHRGLVAEVYKYYQPAVTSISLDGEPKSPDNSLTEDERKVWDSVLKEFYMRGIIPHSEMTSDNNLLKVGGANKIVFIEPEFELFNEDGVRVDDQHTNRFREVWKKHKSRFPTT
jgi:hypothetical protein